MIVEFCAAGNLRRASNSEQQKNLSRKNLPFSRCAAHVIASVQSRRGKCRSPPAKHFAFQKQMKNKNLEVQNGLGEMGSI
jgi:hypothetical protein